MTSRAISRVAVLASGDGSNLQAILDHFSGLGKQSPGQVVLVVSNRANAGALQRARDAGIAAVHVTPTTTPGELNALFAGHLVDLIALAGYLRLVPDAVTRSYRGRIVNVHPALLPDFGGQGMYGRHVHEAVINARVMETGVSVHFVDDQYDRGAIIAQSRVRVRRSDTARTLAARVLKAEHELYPRVIAALCAGTVTLNAEGTVSGADTV